jgi:hypothetical protein
MNERKPDWEVFSQRFVGDAHRVLLESRETAYQYLESELWEWRFASLEVLGGYWKPLIDERPLYRSILEREKVGVVRSAALECLLKSYRGTRDPAFLDYLARIVLNEQAERGHRYAAYFGMYRVLGLPTPLRGATWRRDYETFPACADWLFVRSYVLPTGERPV